MQLWALTDADLFLVVVRIAGRAEGGLFLFIGAVRRRRPLVVVDGVRDDQRLAVVQAQVVDADLGADQARVQLFRTFVHI